MGFPSPSLNVVIDYFSHSCLNMCEICLKRTPDTTFLDCLALTFCDVIGKLLPEWACLVLEGGTIFLLTSKISGYYCLKSEKNSSKYWLYAVKMTVLQILYRMRPGGPNSTQYL